MEPFAALNGVGVAGKPGGEAAQGTEIDTALMIAEMIEKGELIEIKCGSILGFLKVEKFVCPGISTESVWMLGNTELITPKEFVHLGGKASQKDWKASIRMANEWKTMRYLMCEQNTFNFTGHANSCSGKCESRNYLNRSSKKKEKKKDNGGVPARRGRKPRKAREPELAPIQEQLKYDAPLLPVLNINIPSEPQVPVLSQFHSFPSTPTAVSSPMTLKSWTIGGHTSEEEEDVRGHEDVEKMKKNEQKEAVDVVAKPVNPEVQESQGYQYNATVLNTYILQQYLHLMTTFPPILPQPPVIPVAPMVAAAPNGADVQSQLSMMLASIERASLVGEQK